MNHRSARLLWLILPAAVCCKTERPFSPAASTPVLVDTSAPAEPSEGEHLAVGVEPTAAANSAAATAPSTDGASSALANRVRALFADKCYHCHGNSAAEKDVFVLDYDRLVAKGTLVPGGLTSRLLAVVQDGTMPMGGELTADEKALVASWGTSGAAPWESVAPVRTFVTETELVRRIVANLTALPARERQYMRYFSIANLYNSGMSDEELESTRTGLSKLVNSLSWQRKIAIPEPIDPERITLRIDLRSYQWVENTWKVVLARYPYSVVFADGAAVTSLSGASIPYVRADWFVASASVPPLYHDVLELPDHVDKLEVRLGVNSQQNLEQEHGVGRAGVRSSGVSKNNRIVERHESSFGAYWKSHDFSSSTGEQDIFRNPLTFKAAGGEMVFSLPNGLQGYMITDSQGRRLDEAPIGIVSNNTDPSAPVVRNGLTCMSCHFRGIKEFVDNEREILLASNAPVAVDREKVLSLYWEKARMDAAVKEDADRFHTAVTQTGGHLGGSHKTEPVTMLARRFQSDLTVAQAAAELGLEPGEFQTRLRAQPGNGGFPQLVPVDGGVKRDQWEFEFSKAAVSIGKGTVIVQPASPVAARSAAPPPPTTVPPAAPPPPVQPAAVAVKTVPPPIPPASAAAGAQLATAGLALPLPPPRAPAPAPPAEKPVCKSERFVGEWLVTTRVFRGLKPTAAGVNGYYGLRITGSGCSLSVEMAKVAYSSNGKIHPFDREKRQFGQGTLKVNGDGTVGSLEIRLARADGSSVQEGSYFLLAVGGNLDGAWNYEGAAWTSTEMRGTLVGQLASLGYPEHRDIGEVSCLSQCAMQCDVARPETAEVPGATDRFQSCLRWCGSQPGRPRLTGCGF